MTYRARRSWMLVGSMTAFMALAVLPAAGQPPSGRTKTAAKPAAKTGTTLKTPWGDPDLDGTWTSDAHMAAGRVVE
jgi:hypothetical protein